jgi:type IV secretion system protein VirD4
MSNRGKGMWPALVGLLLVLLALAWFGHDIAAAVPVPAVAAAAGVVPWVAGVLLVVVVLSLVYRAYSRRTPRGMLARRAERAKRHRGLAPWWRIVRQSGRWTMYRRARVIRPELEGTRPWHRWRAARLVGYRLVRVGLVWVWVLREMSTMRLAPPGAGKTAEMTHLIIDTDGAVVTTSTKVDVVAHTYRIRAERGPVYVFNPQRLGGFRLRTNFGWNPLVGCTDPQEARRRAGHLLSGSPGMSGVGNREFWESQGVRVLSALLHAAALGERTSMMDVLSWVSDPEHHRDTIMGLLSRSPSARPVIENVAQFLDTNANTRTSTTTTIMPALEWLQDPELARIALDPELPQLDVEELLNRRGTLYLLGEKDGGVAPVFTALTSWVATRMRRIASTSTEVGRLRVPAAFVLDEPANTCAVPLHEWLGDFRGHNMSVHTAFQSRAQLDAKWGKDAGRIIWAATPCKLIMPGIGDEVDLEAISKLCGEYDEEVTTETEGDGGRRAVARAVRRSRVIPPEAVRMLPEFTALVIVAGMEPTIGKFTAVWDRKEVKAARRAEKRDATAAARTGVVSGVPAAPSSGPNVPAAPVPPMSAPPAGGPSLGAVPPAAGPSGPVPAGWGQPPAGPPQAGE